MTYPKVRRTRLQNFVQRVSFDALSVFEHRDDFSTHDASLPLDSAEATTVILRGCEWQGQQAARWDVDVLEPDSSLSDEVRLTILGARKQILFVEELTTASTSPPTTSGLRSDLWVNWLNRSRFIHCQQRSSACAS